MSDIARKTRQWIALTLTTGLLLATSGCAEDILGDCVFPDEERSPLTGVTRAECQEQNGSFTPTSEASLMGPF